MSPLRAQQIYDAQCCRAIWYHVSSRCWEFPSLCISISIFKFTSLIIQCKHLKHQRVYFYIKVKWPILYTSSNQCLHVLSLLQYVCGINEFKAYILPVCISTYLINPYWVKVRLVMDHFTSRLCSKWSQHKCIQNSETSLLVNVICICVSWVLSV